MSMRELRPIECLPLTKPDDGAYLTKIMERINVRDIISIRTSYNLRNNECEPEKSI
jgi:hypothetical protein